MNVGDGALWKVYVEAQKVEVVNWLKFDWVAKKVVVDKCLLIVYDEAVVHVTVVGKVEICVLKEVVVDLVPGVLDQSDSEVAEGRRELGANPGPSDLLVCIVACPENASVERKGDNGSDVRCVKSPLGGVLGVMSANVGVMKRVACGLGVDCQGVCI